MGVTHKQQKRVFIVFVEKVIRLEVEEGEREVLLGLLVFCFFNGEVFLEVEHQLAGIGRVLGVQTVVATAARALDKGVGGLGVAQQVLLHLLVNVLQVGLMEERTVQVIDMLGQQLDADAPLAYIQ